GIAEYQRAEFKQQCFLFFLRKALQLERIGYGVEDVFVIHMLGRREWLVISVFRNRNTARRNSHWLWNACFRRVVVYATHVIMGTAKERRFLVNDIRCCSARSFCTVLKHIFSCLVPSLFRCCGMRKHAVAHTAYICMCKVKTMRV